MSSNRPLAFGFAVVLLFALVARCFSQPIGKTGHIEIFVKPQEANPNNSAAPIPKLSNSNFLLRFQGTTIPLQLVRPKTGPRHLLIVADDPVAVCREIASAKELHDLQKQGWIIQVSNVGKQDVRPASICRDILSNPPLNSLEQLQFVSGRRVVLLVGDIQPAILQDAIQHIPEVYAVDGGVQLTAKTPLLNLKQSGPRQVTETNGIYAVRCREVGGRVAPNDPCNLGVSTTYMANGHRNGYSHEKSIASALGEIVEDQPLYYDIEFPLYKVPSLSKGMLTLTIRKRANMQMRIEAYSESSDGAREPLGMPLRVEQAK